MDKCPQPGVAQGLGELRCAALGGFALTRILEVVAGTADRSYGIHVAKLAGLPSAVVGRAEEVLSSLESGNQAKAAAKLAEDLPLFAAAPVQAAPASTGPDLLREALGSIEPDGLTPKAALDLIYRLKGMA